MNRWFADVSNNNPQNINWGEYYHAGHVLVGLKASEGESFVDKTHATRSENAHKAGCWVIHYHFGHANGSPQQQAQFFWSRTHNHFAPKDFACLDIEVSDGRSDVQVAQWCNQFMGALHQISGHSTIVYSSQSFLSGLVRAGLNVPGGRCWIAAYGPVKAHVGSVSTWAWQRTDGAIGPPPHACAGIGKCDVSELNWGTYLRLRLQRPHV